MADRVPSGYKMTQAMSALQQAKERLLAEDTSMADDALLLQSMLEGDEQAGDCMEVLHGVLRAAVQAKSMGEAARLLADKMTERAQRYAARAAALRAIGFDAMQILELPRIELPDLTAFIAAGQAAVHVTDPDVLPEAFFRIKREVNKTAIAAALKGGATIDGATMGNSPPAIRISTR